jgi:hypothetical protein
MTLISATLRRFGVVFVVEIPRAVLFWRVERTGFVVFVGGVDVFFLVLFAFAFGVVVVSFSRFLFKLAAVLDDFELPFRVVGEDFDEVFLCEVVEDALLGVVFVPFDDELSFAFLGDINHETECWAILPLYSVTWQIGHLA